VNRALCSTAGAAAVVLASLWVSAGTAVAATPAPVSGYQLSHGGDADDGDSGYDGDGDGGQFDYSGSDLHKTDVDEAYAIQREYFGRDTYAYDPLQNQVGTGSAGAAGGASGGAAGGASGGASGGAAGGAAGGASGGAAGGGASGGGAAGGGAGGGGAGGGGAGGGGAGG
jgi:hypothetical protein